MFPSVPGTFGIFFREQPETGGGTARRSHDGGVEAAKLETYRKLGGGMNSNQSEIRSKARSFRLGSESVANIEEGRREIVYICVCIVFAT